MARAAPPPPPPPAAPIDVNLREALEERYLAYALSTVMGRAPPDARDGLKPVHRDILYGMHTLELDPGTAFKKCAGEIRLSSRPVQPISPTAQRLPVDDDKGAICIAGSHS